MMKYEGDWGRNRTRVGNHVVNSRHRYDDDQKHCSNLVMAYIFVQRIHVSNLILRAILLQIMYKTIPFLPSSYLATLNVHVELVWSLNKVLSFNFAKEAVAFV